MITSILILLISKWLFGVLKGKDLTALRQFVMIAFSIFLFAGLFSACSSSSANERYVDVQYVVECTDCLISYKNENGEAINEASTGQRWTYRFQGRPTQFVYVAARSNRPGENLTVRILKNGTLAEQASNQAHHPLVTAGLAL